MNKKLLIYGVALLHTVITVYFWYQNPGQFTGSSAGNTLLALGTLSGFVLASLALLQLLLMGRLPLLEQTWGMDKLARVHAFVGKLFLVFLVAHPTLIIAAYSNLSSFSFVSQYFELLKLDDILGAVVGFWLFVVLIIYALLRVYKKLEFEKWYISHLFMYAAVLLTFGHQQELGSSFQGQEIFGVYWTAIYFLTFAALAAYRLGLPIWRYYKHRFYVEKIEQETSDVWSVYIKGSRLEYLKTLGGQFFIVRFLDKAIWREAHPFSLSTNAGQDHLRFSIKSNGDFSSKISKLKPKTKVYLEGPYGVFTAKQASKEKILLLAGGIGITPFRSMLEDMGKAGKDIVLLYGNKTKQDIALKSELEELASRYSIIVHHVLSNEIAENSTQLTKNSENVHYGFITIELIAKFVPDYLEREVFVCGPPVMMNGLLRSLKQNNLPKHQLHFERFAF